MLRKPAGKEDFVRGRTGQFPFTPGGLEGISNDTQTTSPYSINEKTQIGPLTSIPPGFTRGLRIKCDDEDLDLESTQVDEEETLEVVRSVRLANGEATRQKKQVQSGYEGIDDLLPEQASHYLFFWELMLVPVACAQGTTRFLTTSTRERMGSCGGCKPRDDQLSRTHSRYGSQSSSIIIVI